MPHLHIFLPIFSLPIIIAHACENIAWELYFYSVLIRLFFFLTPLFDSGKIGNRREMGV